MSDFDSPMDTRKLVPILHKRLASLIAARKVAVAGHQAAVKKWKVTIVKWLRDNGPKLVGELTADDINSSERYGGGPFAGFFARAPKPPSLPDDRQIRDVRAFIRQLSIAQPKSVRITTDFTRKYLIDPEDGS